jgi:hypothetical protein
MVLLVNSSKDVNDWWRRGWACVSIHQVEMRQLSWVEVTRRYISMGEDGVLTHGGHPRLPGCLGICPVRMLVAP